MSLQEIAVDIKATSNFIFLQKYLSFRYPPSLHVLKGRCDNNNVTWCSSGEQTNEKNCLCKKFADESVYSRQ